MLSKAAEHAIKAMVYLATKTVEGEFTRIADISEAIGSPLPYTSKILNQLRRNALLESKGGFRLGDNRHISFIQIIEAQEGLSGLDRCVLGLKTCSSSDPCPAHEKYKSIKEQIKQLLAESYVDDFNQEVINMELKLK
jgi:Rrf2 family protein